MDELYEIKNQLRDNISDKDFWTSRAVEEYFTDVSKAILDRYGTDFHLDVEIEYQEGGEIAHTTFDKVVLNAASKQVMKVLNKHHKFLYLKGLLAHELSHILYMDKQYNKRYFDSILQGVLLPRIPMLSGKERCLVEAIRDKQKAAKLCIILKWFSNAVEDGYGENTYLANYYGGLAEGMRYMRKEFFRDLSPASKIEEELASDDPKERWGGVCSIVLSYSLYHKLRGDGDYPLCHKVVEKIDQIIDETLRCNFKERLHHINMLAIELWEYIEPALEGNGQNQSSPESGESAPNGGNEQGQGNGQRQEQSDGGYGGGIPMPDSNKPDHSNDQGNTRPLTNQQNQAVPKPYEDENFEADNNGNGNCPDLSEDVVDELARKKMEENNLRQMNQEANSGNAHGCRVKIYRTPDVTSEMMRKYESYSEELEVSRKIQRTLKQQLDDKRKGGKRSRLYIGRKIEVRDTIKNDGKYFYNNKLPSDVPRISICIGIDESGSMCSTDVKGISRIEYAKKMAVIIEDFCRMLGFPVCIIGSTADWQCENTAELTVYSSFESADNNDRYRLMDISPKMCNRDGALFSFALSLFKKRQEEIKILFIISDGKPNARNYGQMQAVNELKALCERAKKERVVVFSAAIGDDKKQIEAIYGDAFLDITDLDAMPKLFIDRIKKFIKR